MKVLRDAWSSAATAIAVVASALALAFSAWPALRPDPHEMLAARLHVETVEPAVTLGQYLQRTHHELKDAPPSALRHMGHVVYLRIQIQGRKHSGLELHQVLYRVSTGRRIVDQGPTEDAYFQPDTTNDQWIDQVFVAGPAYDFPVFVRLELFDGDALMSFADTPPIAVKR